MAKALWQVVGKKKAKSAKSGNDCFNYYFTGDFSQYDEEHAECEGNVVLSEFSYDDFDVHPGDMVELDYEKGFQDKATLSYIRVMHSGKPFEDKKKTAETK